MMSSVGWISYPDGPVAGKINPRTVPIFPISRRETFVRTIRNIALFLISICSVCVAGHFPVCADEPVDSKSQQPAAGSKAEPGDKLVPLNPQKTVLLDRAGGKLILETEVVFRDGLLEMLVCLKQTKEHESILALDARARTVHAGLLALGAKPGKPVSWDPEFQPPTGQEIEITLMWQDEKGKWQRSKAQRWMRGVTRKYFIIGLKKLPDGFKLPEDSELRYDPKHQELLWFGIMSGEEKKMLLKISSDPTYQKAIQTLYDASQIKPMNSEWVFAGSGFFVEPETGKQFYLAEDGTLICVANFSSATLDVREESSASSGALAYEAWAERIPPLGTRVRVELKPVKKDSKTDASRSGDKR